ncbi:MAG: methionyl-tRNA formyltransferase [Elusimicrobiota bacterium]|jgi:methionyl-tRNA formyltransferase
MKTLFLGTPAIAVPFLERLHQQTSIQSVITNPDQPAGRGYEVKSSPVKEAALRLGLPLLQPEKAGEPGFQNAVRQMSPDFGLAVAYGKLLPKSLLEIPKHGFLNVHFSLLPAYRGAAPIQWALINGETKTGVTLFWLDEGMDTGPVFLQRELPILPEDDAESLREKLVALGLDVLDEAIRELSLGRQTAVPQAGPASKAPMLKKEDGRIDWSRPAQAILNQLRGMTPWPGIYATVDQGGRSIRLKVLKGERVQAGEEGPVGAVTRLDSGEGFVIKCNGGSLKVLHVQPEGKKSMSAWDFWQGARLKVGDHFR